MRDQQCGRAGPHGAHLQRGLPGPHRRADHRAGQLLRVAGEGGGRGQQNQVSHTAGTASPQVIVDLKLVCQYSMLFVLSAEAEHFNNSEM